MKRFLSATIVVFLSTLPTAGSADNDASPIAPYVGRWLLDLDASDPIAPMMKLMDVPWIARKLAGVMTPTVTISELGDRGLRMVNENPILTTDFEMFVDGVEREREDALGRKVVSKQVWNDAGQLVITERTHIDDDRVAVVTSTWARVDDNLELTNILETEEGPLQIRRIFRPKR